MIATIMLCGVLHIVGSEGDTALVLDDGRQRVALEGPVANTLVGTTQSCICVKGTRTTHLAIGAAYSLLVKQVRQTCATCRRRHACTGSSPSARTRQHSRQPTPATC